MPLRIVPSWFGASHLLYTLENQPSRVVYPWRTTLKKSDIGWCGKKITRRLCVGFGGVFGRGCLILSSIQWYRWPELGPTQNSSGCSMICTLFRDGADGELLFKGESRDWPGFPYEMTSTGCSFHPVGFMWSPRDSRCDFCHPEESLWNPCNESKSRWKSPLFLVGEILISGYQWLLVGENFSVLGKLFFWNMSLIEISGLQQAARHQTFSPNHQPTI